VVLWFGFRIFAPDAVSIVWMVRMTVMMRLVTPTIWAMVSRSPGVRLRKIGLGRKNVAGIVGSHPIVGVDS
jgi:hypothetical protein